MGRILSIDYGRKRCGITVTDSLRLVANGLGTVKTAELVDFVKGYVARESVDLIVVGLPKDSHGAESESMRYITPGVAKLKRALPEMRIEFYDERYTSVLAHRSMIDSGMKKMQRRDKATVDTMAVAIILNDYLESKQYKESELK